MTERSDKAAAIAFVVVLVCLVGALVLALLVGPSDARNALAGFIGGIIAVFAVGVARWIGGPRGARRRDDDD